MSKEVVKQESKKDLAVQNEMMAAWGESNVDAGDIIIPKIMLMQPMSVAVLDENNDAKMGDYLDSLTQKVIGSAKKPLQVIPFHLERIWIHSKKSGNDYEFDSITQAVGPKEYEYLETTDGVEWKHEYCMNFYVLNPDDMSLPFVVAFKGASRKSGKALATQMFVKNKAAGKVPPAFVVELGAHKETNDKGTYYVWDIAAKRESTKEEVSTAFEWFKTVNAGGAKAHETDDVSKAEDEARF